MFYVSKLQFFKIYNSNIRVGIYIENIFSRNKNNSKILKIGLGNTNTNSRLYCSEQFIPKSAEEVQDVLDQAPESPNESKLMKIAIIGIPNAGKSTLINKLVKWKVCSVSQKVHTTLCNARAVVTDGNYQLVFLDTPGLVTNAEVQRHKLNKISTTDPEKSLQTADCIAVLQDVSNRYTRKYLAPSVLRLLTLHPNIPSILILNKVDTISFKPRLLSITDKLLKSYTIENKKIERKVTAVHTSEKEFLESKLLSIEEPIIHENKEVMFNELQPEEKEYILPKESYNFTDEDVLGGKIRLTETQVAHFIKDKTSWPKFKEVFMISALQGTGIDDLRNYFIKQAKPSSWLFDRNVLTDQSPQDIAISTVRERCLEHLKNNIPYDLSYKLDYWYLSEADVLSIIVKIDPKKKSYLKYVIGPAGSILKKISMEAEQELRNSFRTEVRLRINVNTEFK